MKKNYVGAKILGLGAVAAALAGCATKQPKKFTIDQYLNKTGIQAEVIAEDKKINPAEIRDMAETYCILHNKLKNGEIKNGAKEKAEKILDNLGRVINTYMNEGNFEIYAYVDASVDGVIRNRGGNVPMPARLKKSALEKMKLYEPLNEDRKETRKKAEFLRRLQTEWTSIQATETKVDLRKFDRFYLKVTPEAFASLLGETVDHRYGGQMFEGEKESSWTAEDHKEYFGEDRTESRKGDTTAFGLVSDYELPVDVELEKVIKAITETESKKEKEESAKKPEIAQGTILVVNGKKVQVKSVNADGSYVTEPVKEEGADEE